MKKLTHCLSIILMLMLGSCSTHVERFPAQKKNEEFDQVFTFPFLEKNSMTGDLGKKFKKEFTIPANRIKTELVEDNNLGAGNAFKVEFDIDKTDNKYVIRLLHAPDALKDRVAFYTVMDFLSGIHTTAKLDQLGYFELYYNAKAGDPFALEAFLKMRAEQDYKYNPNPGDANKYKEYKAQWAKKKDEFSLEVKKKQAKKNKEREQRKAKLAGLDNLAEDKQFRALVAKNDRKGASALLRQYLPWESMAPFEKEFWETYLEVLENPVPLEQKIMIYRGLSGDYIQKAYADGKILTEDEAIIQNKAFLLSPIMANNQGSWNRRLRSLETMNKKYIATHNDLNDFSAGARISTMFEKHSGDPKGSPFISFSPNLEVAEGFSGVDGKKGAYVFDPRLLNFNYASGFKNEIEYLVLMTTFPDELVAIASTKIDPNLEGLEAKHYFDEKLKEKIRILYGNEKENEIFIKIIKNSYDFFKKQYPKMKDVKGVSPAASNLKFYEGFLKKDTPPVAISADGKMTCTDILQLFWEIK